MPRPKKVEEPNEPDPKYAAWILAAIAKVRHQKQRPNEERITHILEITYGVDAETVAEQLELCVKSGRIIHGDFKGKSSYKDASIQTPGSSKSPRMPSDLNKCIKKAIKSEGAIMILPTMSLVFVYFSECDDICNVYECFTLDEKSNLPKICSKHVGNMKFIQVAIAKFAPINPNVQIQILIHC